MITRKQYMDKEATYREYYAQFFGSAYPGIVANRIGADRLAKSTDPHFNDIPLADWDRLSIPLGTSERLRELGDYLTQSGITCINKEAARQYIESL